MFRSAARIVLRGSPATPRRASMSSIVTIDALPKNLVIDDMSVLKEDTVNKKRYIIYLLTNSLTHLLTRLLTRLLRGILHHDDYNFAILPSAIPREQPALAFKSPGVKSDIKAQFNPDIFKVAIRKDIVHEVIRYQRHKIRQPKKTKRMGELRGSKKKPRPQKGQGYSQVGNRRNSAWRGGQKAHGPRLRDYSIGCNRKFRAMGMMIALAAKYREGNLLVFDTLNVETHKTRELHQLLSSHNIISPDENVMSTCLFVDSAYDRNFLLAVRNIPNMDAIEQDSANVYDIVKKEKLAISVDAFHKLQARVWEQYQYLGTRKALLRGLASMQVK